MKKILGVMVILVLSTSVWARGKSAASGGTEGDPQVIAAVHQWMTPFQKKDLATLRGAGTTFDEWVVNPSGGLRQTLAPENALHTVTEFRIESVATLVPGQMAVAFVQEIIEDEPVREWETLLTLTRSGGGWQVAHAAHVVVEYHMPGHPEGCPETVFRRDLVASLDGNLRGSGDSHFIRVYTLRRDTEPWGGGATELDTEATKCQMKPETIVQDLEWLVTDWKGDLLFAQQIGRGTEESGGISLFEGNSNGSVTRGGVRLETLVSGQPGVVFLSRKYEGGSKSGGAAVARVGAYVWKGGALKNVWNFDFKRKGASFLVDLKPGEAGKMVVATLQSGGDGIGCPDDSVVSWQWTGSNLKVKDKAKGSCTGTHWPGEGGILSRNGFKLPPSPSGD